MPYKFNPITGNLDLVNTSSGSSGADYHSGFYQITAETTITEYKQSVTFGLLVLDADLIIDGQLILEP